MSENIKSVFLDNKKFILRIKIRIYTVVLILIFYGKIGGQQVEKYVLFFNSSKTSQVEKEALCNKGKALYQKYCFQLKGNPDVDMPRLSQKMDELLHFMAACEAKRLLHIREKQVAGERIDLELVFEEEKNVRVLMCKPIDIVIGEVFSNKKYTVVGEDMGAVYMTASGSKYHRKDCPFCKGKTLILTNLKKAENIGLTSCKCMENTTILKQQTKAKKYVTAFVDESIRVNPWKELDESIPEKQGIHSYIICEGRLTAESQITEENTLYTNVCTTQEVHSTGEIAIEAILAVLFRLIASGYCDNVLIYTDNQEAKDSWYKSTTNHSLAQLFASVMVCFIPREQNRKADKLGRDRAFMELPVETMGKILERSRGYLKVKDELVFVKKYFPVPKKNIPNLMAELKALAEDMKGGC